MSDAFLIWRDIPGYEGAYQVSNTGSIRSLPRIVRSGKYGAWHARERILSLHMNRSGYLRCTLCRHGKMKSYYVHHLVWASFGGIPAHYPDTQIDHIDNNKTDNSITNLQLLSARINIIKSRQGLKKSSKYTGVCRLKNSQKWVARIRVHRHVHHLGYFATELDAAKAYRAALKLTVRAA